MNYSDFLPYILRSPVIRHEVFEGSENQGERRAELMGDISVESETFLIKFLLIGALFRFYFKCGAPVYFSFIIFDPYPDSDNEKHQINNPRPPCVPQRRIHFDSHRRHVYIAPFLIGETRPHLECIITGRQVPVVDMILTHRHAPVGIDAIEHHGIFYKRGLGIIRNREYNPD
ncbi:hypothetical protein IMSAGC016_01241 [Muribaculaceae bacterium]|nr:hypothetical protein IMSAGC016_01241 [Muribaculaceae bacterium]